MCSASVPAARLQAGGSEIEFRHQEIELQTDALPPTKNKRALTSCLRMQLTVYCSVFIRVCILVGV